MRRAWSIRWRRAIWPFLRLQGRVFVYLAFVMVLIGLPRPETQRIGDRLQIALPLVALGCAAAEGRALQYFGRYLLLEAGIKGPKFLLGDLPMNQRPDGSGQGFPSGHTAAATFGATALAATCMRHSKLAQGVTLTSAAFVGGSRVEAGKHTLWQVLAGGLWGWFVQAAALIWFDRMFRRLCGRLGRWFARLRTAPGRWLCPPVAAIVSLSALVVVLPGPGGAQTSIDLYSGWQTAPHSGVTGSDPAGAGAFDFRAGWEGRSFEAPAHYGLRATFWRDPRWGYMIDFNHTKVYADAATLGPAGTSGGFQVLEFTDGLNALTFGVMRRHPEVFDRVTPYWALGLGVAIPHVEVQSQPGAPKTEHYHLAGPALSGAVGASYDLSERWAVFGEYKMTYSQLSAELEGGGQLNTDIITNAINFGVRYTFN